MHLCLGLNWIDLVIDPLTAAVSRRIILSAEP